MDDRLELDEVAINQIKEIAHRLWQDAKVPGDLLTLHFRALEIYIGRHGMRPQFLVKS